MAKKDVHHFQHFHFGGKVPIWKHSGSFVLSIVFSVKKPSKSFEESFLK